MKKFATPIAALAIGTLCLPAYADTSLAADDPPGDTPWKQPATLSYVRNGDGDSSGTVNAVLRYKSSNVATDGNAAVASNAAYGVYWHKDTDPKARRNDRGIEATYGKLIFRDSNPSGAVTSLSWKAKASLGRGIQKFEDASQKPQEAERTKDRQTATIGGYFQPKLSGTPPRPGTNDRPDAIWFFEGFATLYSDHSSGGNGKGIGRLTGGMTGVSVNLAPLGLDPAFNSFGNLGFVPSFRLSAQVQSDANATGDRKKETRKLYSAEVSFAFGKLGSSNGVVPSVNLARTYGADVLTGRANSSKTELSLGLSF